MYYSITRPHPICAPWQPLATDPQMETRPCYYTSSRVHTLTCGHTIAVPNNAEPCAANCAGYSAVEATSNCFIGPVPSVYAAALEKTRRHILDAFNAYITTLFTSKDYAQALDEYNLHRNTITQLWTLQEKRLRPIPDLLSGDFSCTKCGTVGYRESLPAFNLAYDPYFCIVVGRDKQDLAVIAALEKGVHPDQLLNSDRYAGARNRVVTNWERRVRDGRITKHRVEEKRDVVGKLRNENLLAELRILGLGG